MTPKPPLIEFGWDSRTLKFGRWFAIHCDDLGRSGDSYDFWLRYFYIGHFWIAIRRRCGCVIQSRASGGKVWNHDIPGGPGETKWIANPNPPAKRSSESMTKGDSHGDKETENADEADAPDAEERL